MNTKPTLDNVCIRAYMEKGWESVTLREIIKAGRGGQALNWLMERLIGLKEAEMISEEHIQRGLDLLDPNTIVMLKDPQ